MEALLTTLYEHNLIYTVVACGHCVNQTKIVQESTKTYHRCIKRSYRKKLSVFYETIFFDYSVAISKIMMIAYLWLNKLKVMQIVAMAGLHHQKVKIYMNKCKNSNTYN